MKLTHFIVKLSIMTDDFVELYREAREMQKAITCSICLSKFIDPAVLSCRHTFCKECIETAANFRMKCPICLAVINKRNITSAPYLSNIIMAVDSFVCVILSKKRYNDTEWDQIHTKSKILNVNNDMQYSTSIATSNVTPMSSSSSSRCGFSADVMTSDSAVCVSSVLMSPTISDSTTYITSTVSTSFSSSSSSSSASSYSVYPFSADIIPDTYEDMEEHYTTENHHIEEVIADSYSNISTFLQNLDSKSIMTTAQLPIYHTTKQITTSDVHEYQPINIGDVIAAVSTTSNVGSDLANYSDGEFV